MAHIIVIMDLYKYQFSVNLAKDGIAYGKKNFRNPVKAMDYMGQLQQQGHQGPDHETGSKLVELAELWRANS